MSKKDKRIKKLEQLNADMAIECDEMEMTISRLHGSNIKMIDGLLRIRKERDSLRHDSGESQAGQEAMMDIACARERALYQAISERDELREQLDECQLSHTKSNEHVYWLEDKLGECQAGREALQRYIDDLAPIAVWKAHAKETAVYADEMKTKNAELKKELIAMQNKIVIAQRWKTYATSIESQIEILQTAIDERDERLDNIKFFLSDGDE